MRVIDNFFVSSRVHAATRPWDTGQEAFDDSSREEFRLVSSLISGGRSKAVWDERMDQRRLQRAQARGRQKWSN